MLFTGRPAEEEAEDHDRGERVPRAPGMPASALRDTTAVGATLTLEDLQRRRSTVGGDGRGDPDTQRHPFGVCDAKELSGEWSMAGPLSQGDCAMMGSLG